MFKAPALRRSFSLFRRGVDAELARSAAQSGHDVVRIQRVRFIKPLFSRRKLFKYSLYASTFCLAWYAWDSIPSDDEEEDSSAESRPAASRTPQIYPRNGTGEQRRLSDGGKEDRAPLIFIPTGFTRQKKQEYYKGSDPEWQEFCRISNDPKYQNEVIVALVATIRAAAAAEPSLKRLIGKIDQNSGWRWVGIVYPDGPSPEFERPGIVIDGQWNVRSATQTVSTENNHRLNRIIWPVPVATAMYESWKAYARWTARQVNKSFFSGKNAAGEEEGFQKTLRHGRGPVSPSPTMPLPRSGPNSPNPSVRQDNSPASTTASSDMKSAEASTSPTPPKDTKSSPPNAIDTSTLHSKLPSQIKATLYVADLATFRRTLRREWKPAKPHLPRGAVRVDGQVEALGTDGSAVFDVIAVYDTKTRRYLSIRIGLRRVIKFHQTPKGGP